MFSIQLNIRTNENNIKRIKELVDWYNSNEKDDDETEYNASQIVRIAINKLHKEKFQNQKK